MRIRSQAKSVHIRRVEKIDQNGDSKTPNPPKNTKNGLRVAKKALSVPKRPKSVSNQNRQFQAISGNSNNIFKIKRPSRGQAATSDKLNGPKNPNLGQNLPQQKNNFFGNSGLRDVDILRKSIRDSKVRSAWKLQPTPNQQESSESKIKCFVQVSKKRRRKASGWQKQD